MVVSELLKSSLCGAKEPGCYKYSFLIFFYHRTNTWAGVAPMAKEISALGVAELNGFLYAVGGWHRGRPLNSVLR